MLLNSADEGVLRRPAKDVTTLSGSRSRSLLVSLSIHLLLEKRWTIHGTSHARVTGRYEGEEWTGQRGDGVRASLRSRGRALVPCACRTSPTLGSPGRPRILTPDERSPTASDMEGGHVEGVAETTVKARVRRETTEDHPKTRRQRSAVGHRIWPMALGARGNVTIVTEFGGTNPSHNQKRKQSGAAAEQSRKGLIDRIFPSEREIAPTASNKTEEGGHTTTASFFFPLSPPPTQLSNTMILVHKPFPISSPAPAHYHRRMPSAPNVSVQPTRTPGLLSIIPNQQPQRSSQPQRSQQRSTPLKENRRQNRSPKPTGAKAQPVILQEVIKLSVAESDKPKSVKPQSKNPSPTPEKSSSGRANQKRSPKDKAATERYRFSGYRFLLVFWYSFEGTQESFLDACQAAPPTSSPTISFRNPCPG